MILELQNISKDFGIKRAIQDISFSGSPGEIVGLIGPNGAGKTTLISIILGLVEQSKGTVKILDSVLRFGSRHIFHHVNYAASYAELPSNLTVYENLKVYGLLYDVPSLKKRILEVVNIFGLGSLVEKKSGLLSTGERMKLVLAKALLNKPKILLLDEPTSSLDPHVSRLIRNVIVEFVASEKAFVLWTSHDMHEIESVSDRVMFLRNGSIILEGKTIDLAKKHAVQNLEELFLLVNADTKI